MENRLENWIRAANAIALIGRGVGFDVAILQPPACLHLLFGGGQA
jgi:hypothetical protein